MNHVAAHVVERRLHLHQVIALTIVIIIGDGARLGIDDPCAEFHGFQHQFVFHVVLLDLGKLSQLRLQCLTLTILTEKHHEKNEQQDDAYHPNQHFRTDRALLCYQ